MQFSCALFMSVHMGFKIELCEEHSAAGLTLKSFDSLVHFKMLIQVSSLGESKFTVFLGALKGSLTGMNS
jgi:hypothetical protein